MFAIHAKSNYIYISTYINNNMDAVRGLGTLALGSRLKRLSEHLMREIQLVYDAVDVNFDPYWFPVFSVVQQKKETTTSAIAEATLTTQPSVTQTLKKLCEAGLVELTVSEKDKRKKLVVLSAKGIILAEQLKPVWKAMKDYTQNLSQQPTQSLAEHLNRIEDTLENEVMHQSILNQITMANHDKTPIIDYTPEHAKAFYELNIEWLETFFYVEDYDREVLSNPDQYILNKGGRIFFIMHEGKVAGTVALMKVNDKVFELTKMAVNTELRGLKLGQKLMQHCLDEAKNMGLDKVILYSNTKLENAIYIYRKYGFIEITVEEGCPYERCNIKMEYLIR